MILLLAIAGISYWLNPVSWHHLTRFQESEFGGGVLVVGVLSVVLRNKMYLKMDEHGLEVQLAVGAPRIHAWRDIEGVRIVKLTFLLIPLASSIHLSLRPQPRPGTSLRKIVGSVIGSASSFPAFFDSSAEEIVKRIEYFRRESSNASPASDGR